MTGGMSSRTCYPKLNFDFPYVRSLSLRRAAYIHNTNNIEQTQTHTHTHPTPPPPTHTYRYDLTDDVKFR